MKIERILVYQVDLPLHEGTYSWSGGKSVDVFDSNIVAIETDTGHVGYGECCPLGPFYLPAYAAGVRSGIKELGPHLIGMDPTRLLPLNRFMDRALKGHAYVKSPIDIACWDILGQVSGQPICELLGGRYGEDFVLYRAISQQEPEAMADNVAGYRSEGYRRFQLKVGGDPNVDIERIRQVADRLEDGDKLVADANTGWLMHEADVLCVLCRISTCISNSRVRRTTSVYRFVGVQAIHLYWTRTSTGWMFLCVVMQIRRWTW